jgi:hypothetical protein
MPPVPARGSIGLSAANGLKRSAASERRAYAFSIAAMKLNNQTLPGNPSLRYVIERMKDACQSV